MSDIIVKFKPQGNRALVRAIEELQAATQKYGGTIPRANKEAMKLTGTLKAQNLTWKKLGVSTRTLRQAYRGNITALAKLRMAIKKTTRASHGMLKSSRLLDHSFATMRSHMLLFSFAMSLGIRQLIKFTKQAARVQAMEKGFNTLSGGANNAAISMTKLKLATNGTMSEMAIFEQANNAMILGVTNNSDEMSEMFDMAQRLGRALGVDTERSIQSLVTGLGRQSVKMLDNIGIIVKSNEAYEDYAKANNKVASELTDGEKRQAFFTAALESGRKKMQQLGPETLTAKDSFDRFGATMSDVATSFGEASSPAITSFMDQFSDWVFRLTAGPMEELVHDLSAAGIEVTKFTGIMEALEQEQADVAIKKVTNSSAQLIDKMLSLAPSTELFELALKHAGVGMKDLEGIAKGLAIANDVLSNSQDQYTGKVLDFSNATMKQLNVAITVYQNQLKEILQAQEDGKTHTEDGIEITDELIGIYNDQILTLASLTKAVNDYNAAMAVKNGTNEKDNESQDENTESTKAAATASKELNDTIRERNTLLNKQMSAISKAATGFAALGKELGVNEKAIMALQAVSALANAHSAASDVLADKEIQPTWLRYAAAAGMYAQGLAHVLAIRKAESQAGSAVGKFEQGGYIGGRPHSQGGTIIEAERGEFVMSRNAVESIGLETLSMMNEGGGGSVNVTVTGNVMTQDFVEGELAESIKEAVRRGSDFGIS